jgi:hypothetical protein
MGLTFQRVVDGDPDTLRKLAELTGANLGLLCAEAIVRDGNSYRLGQERFLKSTLRRDRLHVCPACLSDDVQGSNLDPACAARGRTIWLLNHIETCAKHGLGLLEIARGAGPHSLHDFALLVGPALPQLPQLVESAPRRIARSYEVYLQQRLAGATGNVAFLDKLDWHAAALTCEMLGAVALRGRKILLRQLTTADWLDAGQAGFEIAQQGGDGVRALLTKLQKTFPATRVANEGPAAVFASLHEWLANDRGTDPAYDPVRELVSNHIVDTMPLGPGDELFGKPVLRRRLHSVRTAALQTGCHPKRLRKILATSGFIDADHVGKLDHHVLFDAAQAEPLLANAKGALCQSEIGGYLNAARSQVQVLIDEGFITPFVTASGSIGRYGFVKAELDRFLAQLFLGASEVASSTGSQHTIPSAAKHANCRIAEVIQLILERKLKFVGRNVSERGFLSVLVDADEIKTRVRGKEVDGLPLYKAVRHLGTSERVAKALIELGVLRTKREINPQNRCPTDFIIRSDLDAFRENYATLFQLSGETGVHHLAIRDAFNERGIRPAFDPTVVHATIYKRGELPV